MESPRRDTLTHREPPLSVWRGPTPRAMGRFGALSVIVIMGLKVKTCLPHTSSAVRMGNPDGSSKELLKSRVWLPAEYSKYQLPPVNGTPVTVLTSFGVEDFPDISDDKLQLTMSFYFRLYWNDSRLIVNFTQDEVDRGAYIPLHLNILDDLWKPDVFVYNMTRFDQVKSLEPMGGVSIKPTSLDTGQMCDMDFSFFPMDKQECPFQVGSANHVAEIMTFRGNRFHNHLRGQPSHVYDIKLTRLKNHQKLAIYPTGKWSLAGFNVNLRRFATPYFMKYYLPCGTMVCVSWISFLIPSHAIPGRTTLLVTLFLVLTGFFDNIQASTPHSLGLTALTSYVLTCLAFVFFAMCVFAFLLLRDRIANSRSASAAAANMVAPESVYRPQTSSSEGVVNGGGVRRVMETNGMHKMARVVEEVQRNIKRHDQLDFSFDRKVDYFSIFLFSTSFLIYNLVYLFVHL